MVLMEDTMKARKRECEKDTIKCKLLELFRTTLELIL